MKKIIVLLSVSFCFLLVSGQSVFAGSGPVGVGIKAGTLGGGVEVTIRMTEKLNFRVGGNKFSHDETATEDDIEYDMEIDLASAAALLDYHPFGGGFRLTAGALFNGNEINIKSTTAASYDIGGTIYNAQPGDVTGVIDFKSVAPYASLGWGNAVGKDSNFSFSCELGVVFQGKPKVDLTTNVALGVAQAEVEQEERNLQESLDKYEYYPVASLGISYHF